MPKSTNEDSIYKGKRGRKREPSQYSMTTSGSSNRSRRSHRTTSGFNSNSRSQEPANDRHQPSIAENVGENTPARQKNHRRRSSSSRSSNNKSGIKTIVSGGLTVAFAVATNILMKSLDENVSALAVGTGIGGTLSLMATASYAWDYFSTPKSSRSSSRSGSSRRHSRSSHSKSHSGLS